MTNFEQTLLQEVATLPESRRADVLAFVRYLKLSIPGEELEITVNANPEPNITGPTLVCDDEEANYETADNSGNSYTWEVEGGEIIDGAGTHQITVLWGSPGMGIVRVTEETAAGCSTTTDDYEVTIDECTGINDYLKFYLPQQNQIHH